MSRTRIRVAALAAAALTAGALAAAPAAVAAGHPAGVVGSSVTIAKAADIIGTYDVATNAAGTAYIAWVANSSSPTYRQIHLCTLPVAASTCSGGVQTISTHGPWASDVRVLLSSSGVVRLVWFDNGPLSQEGPQGGEIVTATAPNGLNLGAPSVAGSAPSNGSLLDAELSPGGNLYTVAYAGVTATAVQVRSAANGPYVSVHVPYAVGVGKLGFSGNTPVVAITKYGSVSSAARWSSRNTNGAWSTFAPVAGTWTGGGLGLAHSSHGLRLVAGVSNATYRPVVAAWNGHGFDTPRLTVDKNNCGPSTHDTTTDSSGRLLDVSWECNDVTIANYADGATASVLRFHTPGTPTSAPAVSASRRGTATVVWSNENKAGGSDVHATRVRLNVATRSVAGHATGGSVVVHGPISCLPAVQTPIGLAGVAARGWTKLRSSLKLGSSSITSLDGAALSSDKLYVLHGVVVFGKGSATSVARADLTFRTC